MVAQSSIAAVRQRIADIGQGTYSGSTLITPGITGIAHAYAHAPSSITIDVPVMIVFSAGPAEYEQSEWGEEVVNETREYPIRLYAKSKGDGIDMEGETYAESFIEPIRDAFLGRPSLGFGIVGTGLPGVLKTKLSNDTGVQVMSYSGQDYLGVGFTLSVTQVIKRNYAPGE